MSDWLPIDSAPKRHGASILAHDSIRGARVIVYWLDPAECFEGMIDHEGWYVIDGQRDPLWYRNQHQFTDWMPVPAPPTAPPSPAKP